jgi:hypothetical protein
MGDEILTVGAALRTINQASHHALVSFTLELYEANHVISKALLSQHQGSPLDTYEGQKASVAESEGNTITLNDEPTQSSTQSETQNMLHAEVRPSRSEIALVKLAEYCLHTRAINSEYRGGRSDLHLMFRKAMISNSPAVLAALKRFLVKKKRSAE